VLSVALVALAALGLRFFFLPILPIPEPVVHDEFGYLLAADTFAHGRLTNPTHPLWEHFQTSAVIQKPTYQCFAQPGQGALLALGQLLFGNPFWAVWLSAGVMCASITWMLQAWLPPQWALLGGVLSIVRFGVFSYWANSYWGGALASVGGCLVLGAFARIKRSQRPRDAWLLGVGLLILANTRPYEGFIFSLPVAVAMMSWILGKGGPEFRTALGRVIIPVVLVLSMTAGELGYYFWRVTGSPIRMPYSVERLEYGVSPYMVWQRVRQQQPQYQHTVFSERYIAGELVAYRVLRSPIGFAMKAFWAWQFYLGPALTLPLLLVGITLPWGFRWRDITPDSRFLIIEAILVGIGVSLEVFYSPHYSAPATGLVLALVLIAMRRVASWAARRKSGAFLARSVAIIVILMFGLRTAAVWLHIPVQQFYMFAWHQRATGGLARAAVERQLQQMPGQQLVIVRYKPDHDLFFDWVHNDADIDHSKVVWANELGGANDAGLIHYFKGRNVFLLQADEEPPKLSRYPIK